MTDSRRICHFLLRIFTDRSPHSPGLKQNHEFRRLYSKGKSAVSPYFAIYCRKTKRPNSRLGITTGLKLGNAVKRRIL